MIRYPVENSGMPTSTCLGWHHADRGGIDHHGRAAWIRQSDDLNQKTERMI
jgi:hypothetical protein